MGGVYKFIKINSMGEVDRNSRVQSTTTFTSFIKRGGREIGEEEDDDEPSGNYYLNITIIFFWKI
jgi:hypothetical protein